MTLSRLHSCWILWARVSPEYPAPTQMILSFRLVSAAASSCGSQLSEWPTQFSEVPFADVVLVILILKCFAQDSGVWIQDSTELLEEEERRGEGGNVWFWKGQEFEGWNVEKPESCGEWYFAARKFVSYLEFNVHTSSLTYVHSVCIASIIRIVTINHLIKSIDLTWVMADVFRWSCCRPFIGTLCACLPTLAPFFRRWWSTVRTHDTSGTPNDGSKIMFPIRRAELLKPKKLISLQAQPIRDTFRRYKHWSGWIRV